MPEEKNHGKKLISWKFPELNQYEKNRGWYFTAFAVVIFFLIYSVFTKNILFPIVIIMIILVILMMQKESRMVEFSIFETGIVIGMQFFDFKDIEKFYIIYDPPEIKTLYFEFKSIFHPRIPIKLTDQNPVKVREILLNFLIEDTDKDNEPLSDQIARFFKL
ncbi:hypothetical protein C4569_04090 [Candidatus Parcubacteria bacterium]|nr:MAG: hypothetical protein C4569_04090 [Candidatus Parcubacteria bacterium]